MAPGQFGIWMGPRVLGDDAEPDAASVASLIEDLGFGALWVGGSPKLAGVRPLLASSNRLLVATGVVNAWQYEPQELAAERADLAASFPGRLLLGVGINHPEEVGEYSRPVARMRAFFDGLDAATSPVPREERCMAALGPRMLELSAERWLGAHTYFAPVEHTRFARDLLGPDALIAVEVACVLEPNAESARAAAKRYADFYLVLSNYTNNLLRHGFSEEDIAGGGSDRLIDALIPHGSAGEDRRRRPRAHRRRREPRVPATDRRRGHPARGVGGARCCAHRLTAMLPHDTGRYQ